MILKIFNHCDLNFSEYKKHSLEHNFFGDLFICLKATKISQLEENKNTILKLQVKVFQVWCVLNQALWGLGQLTYG